MAEQGKGQPEALATFAEAARNDGKKPKNQGLTANEATRAVAADPKAKQDAAAKVLREGVTGRDEGADEAIDALPDRAAPRHK